MWEPLIPSCRESRFSGTGQVSFCHCRLTVCELESLPDTDDRKLVEVQGRIYFGKFDFEIDARCRPHGPGRVWLDLGGDVVSHRQYWDIGNFLPKQCGTNVQVTVCSLWNPGRMKNPATAGKACAKTYRMQSMMPSLHKLRLIGFKALQSVGFHVVRNHFYQPIPDTRKLPESTWTKPSSLVGIEMNESSQLKLLAAVCGQFGAEFGSIPTGSQFGPVDLEILYSMVRQFRPSVVLEVGSGTSTRISASALIKNGCGELVAIEPYPNETIKKGFPGLTRIIVAPVQQVELSEFECLGENDILFIDSSHVLKIGSDVEFLFLEVLPRLKTGVVIHIHDIFLPANYPRHSVVDGLRFWNEQYILQAFLAFNRAFEVLWAGNYMNMKYPERLEAVFPSYRRGQTLVGSFWMRKVC